MRNRPMREALARVRNASPAKMTTRERPTESKAPVTGKTAATGMIAKGANPKNKSRAAKSSLARSVGESVDDFKRRSRSLSSSSSRIVNPLARGDAARAHRQTAHQARRLPRLDHLRDPVVNA